MFDRKPFIKKSLWPDRNKLKPDYSGRISTNLSNRTTSTGTPLRLFSTPPHPFFKRITSVIPISHCVPHTHKGRINCCAWKFFRKIFDILRPTYIMYSLKWLHLYRLTVRQTYQRKCFRGSVMRMWKFSSKRIVRIHYARALYMLYAPILGANTPYVPSVECFQFILA